MKKKKGYGEIFWLGILLVFLSYWIPKYSYALNKTGWGLFFVALFLATVSVINDKNRRNKEM